MANSQHQNGVTEILVKLVKGIKKSLRHSLGDTRLSLNEMNTLMIFHYEELRGFGLYQIHVRLFHYEILALR